MKIKMNKDVVGAVDNGGSTMLYKAGQTYQMNSKLEMEMATAWCNDGRAEKAITNSILINKSCFRSKCKKSNKKKYYFKKLIMVN